MSAQSEWLAVRESSGLIDPNGTEVMAEYFVLRIYRQHPGRGGEPASLAGVVEDAEGRGRAFRNREELWEALAEFVRHPAG